MAVEDPKDLPKADQDIRINELRHEVNDLAGAEESMSVSPDCPPDVEEQFLRNILAFERAQSVTPLERLARDGLALPNPASATDADVSAVLWQAIEALAAAGTFLSNTNHLSDRELYTLLWTDLLHQPSPDLPPDSGWTNYLDILGSGSEEDILLHLKFYADDRDRAFWAKEWPDMAIPPHEDPPYDRDRRLPQPPDPRPPDEDNDSGVYDV